MNLKICQIALAKLRLVMVVVEVLTAMRTQANAANLQKSCVEGVFDSSRNRQRSRI